MALAAKSLPIKEVVGAIAVAIIFGGWALKENVSKHDSDIKDVRFEHARGQDSVIYLLRDIQKELKQETCRHHREGC